MKNSASRSEYVYHLKNWIPRALKYARTLHGRPHTPEEEQFKKEYPDDYFRVFGIQTDTQAYLDKTIQFLGELDGTDFAQAVVARIRLKWSAQSILHPEKWNGD